MYRVIVIDDEKLSCEFVSKYIENQNCGFKVEKSFYDSIEALEYIKDNAVDLVVTDIKMPDIDGLELTEIINRINPQCKIIIMSGYSNFEYAHKAIKYNVHDYILKPIDVDELTRSLIKLKEEFDNDQVRQKENLEGTERFFSMLINSEITKKEQIKENIKNLNLPEDIENLTGEVYKVKFLNFESYISQNWKYGSKRLITAMINVLSLRFHFKYIYCVSGINGDFIFVCFFSDRKINKISDDMITDAYRKDINIETDITWNFAFKSIYEIADKIKNIETFKESVERIVDNLILKEKEEVFSEIQFLIGNGYTYEEFVAMLNHRLKKRNLAIKVTKENFVKKQHIAELIDKISKYSETDENSMRVVLKQYIEMNYMNDLTREQVAKAFYINSSYFSIYFKNIMGKSFKEYLRHVRIEKAKSLLSSGVKPQKVSKMVGYNDFRYFKNNFKEHTGFSFEEYENKFLLEE